MSTTDRSHRLGLVAITAMTLFGALFARLWYLQVVEGPSLEAAASRLATRTVTVPAPRGRILDRNGIVLVDNRESIVVAIDWQSYQEMKAPTQTALLRRLAKSLNVARPAEQRVTPTFLRNRLNDPRFTHFRPVPVAEDVPPEQEIYLREQADEFPTVTVQRQTVRSYPYGSLAAHVLGYVGPLTDAQWQNLKKLNDRLKPYVQTDDIGKAGVESAYENYLRGRPGRRVYEVDRRNLAVGEVTSRRLAPQPGDDVYLSIDARLQGTTEMALRQGLDSRRKTISQLGHFRAEGGASSIVDPASGQVLAMASYPTYNPATLVGGISCPVWRDLQGLTPQGSCRNVNKELAAIPSVDRPRSKLVNRALAGTYPPGSTFKLATAFAAIKLGILRPDTTYTDIGYFPIPGCTVGKCRVTSPSAESSGIGTVNLSQAITASSDSYFYKLGNDTWALYKQARRVGPTAFQNEVAKLGFGKLTGIDLPSESPGRLPDPNWLRRFDQALNGKATDAGVWTAGSSINLAIGQGDMLATPLQIANAYASFANGGTLYRTSVVAKITAAGQPRKLVKEFTPQVINRVDWGADTHFALLDGFQGVTQPRPNSTGATAFEGFPQAVWPAAGKTGTAQNGSDLVPKDDHSWFVGFGPTPNPRVAASMVMENAGFGGAGSAPAVRRILEAVALNQLGQVDLASLADPNALGSLVPGAVPPPPPPTTTPVPGPAH
ncbi:MAG: penicillin-binding protein 2 [Acidimicrobiales bacterium]